MAGLGWRKFQAGEVLTANNLQSYAVDQTVQVYAGTAARGSAIGTAVSEGMVSYLADSNDVQAYDGSAWFSVKSPVGSIVQIVQGTYETQFATTSTTPVASGLSVNITPKSASNKILVIVAANMYQSAAGRYGRGAIFRDSTNLGEGINNGNAAIYNGSNDIVTHVTPTILDSPNTTSVITYSWRIFSQSGGTCFSPLAGNRNVITVIEVVA